MAVYQTTLTCHTTDGIRSTTTDEPMPLGETMDGVAGVIAVVGEENVIEIRIERTPRHG